MQKIVFMNILMCGFCC